MADVRQRVLDAADGVAQSLMYQIGRLEGELQEKQAELDVINRKLKAASDAATRRKIFVVGLTLSPCQGLGYNHSSFIASISLPGTFGIV